MTVFADRLRTLLPKSKFARSVGVLAGGTAFAQGLVLLVSPLITRLYTPDSFGVLAVFTSVLSIAVVPASLRYEMAILLPERDEDAANLLSLALIITLINSCLFGFLIVLMGDWIEAVTQTPALHPSLWLLPLALLGAGVFQVLNFWTIRHRAYDRIAQAKWKQSIALVVVQISCGYWKMGTLGLVLGDVISRACGTGGLLANTWRKDHAILKRLSLQGICKVLHRYRLFPLLSSWSAILNSVVLQVPSLFLVTHYSSSVVGWYALAQRLLGVPLNLISGAVGQVYLTESAKLVVHSPDQLERLFWKTMKNMLLLGGPIVAVIALMAPWFFTHVFGKQWGEAGVYLQYLAPMFLLDFVANSTGGTIDVLERQELHVIRECLRLIFVTLAAWTSVFFSFTPNGALLVLSAAGTLGYLLHQFLSWYAIRIFVKRGFRKKQNGGGS